MGSTPLKPCPFCPDGGKAHATQENLPVRQPERAECLSCFAEMEGPGSIDRWNTRAKLPSQGGEAVAWAICKEPGLVDWLSATYANKRAAEAHVASYKDGLTLYITPLYTHPAALSTTNGEEKNHGL